MKLRWRHGVSTVGLLLFTFLGGAGFYGCSSSQPTTGEELANSAEGDENEAEPPDQAESGEGNAGGIAQQAPSGQQALAAQEIPAQNKEVSAQLAAPVQAAPVQAAPAAVPVQAVTEEEGDVATDDAGYVAGMSGEAAGPGLPEMGSKMSYVVRPGDTLSKIAKKIYNDMKKWRVIAEFSALANPNLIYPGDVLYYQLAQETVAFAQKNEDAISKTVTAKKGDNFETLAQKVYGDAGLSKILWRSNGHINDSASIEEGVSVKVPSLNSEFEEVSVKKMSKLASFVKKQTLTKQAKKSV
ncbi:MAG: LysM peptidoglycan-binding domain-containing protein [Oligoflexales bacterium]|nr:LysM peptidoglycan-binding domain-containing protein [Oligoflexales bacterium]